VRLTMILPSGERLWTEVQSAEVTIDNKNILITQGGIFEIQYKPVEIEVKSD